MSSVCEARINVRGDITQQVKRAFPNFGYGNCILLEYKDRDTSMYAIRIGKIRLNITSDFSVFPKPFGPAGNGQQEGLDSSFDSAGSLDFADGMIKLRSSSGDLDLKFDLSSKQGLQEYKEWNERLCLCVASAICVEAFQVRYTPITYAYAYTPIRTKIQMLI